MELNETIKMMQSKDYKERFKAEYYQLKIRTEKLKSMLEKWDSGKLNFSPTCPRNVYDIQIKAMSNYIDILELRAEIEGVLL